MPALCSDLVGIGPFSAGIFMFVGKPKHRCDAGERGRWCGRQLPVDGVDRVTSSRATVGCFIQADAVFLGFLLCADCAAMGDVRRPFVGDQHERRIRPAGPGHGHGLGDIRRPRGGGKGASTDGARDRGHSEETAPHGIAWREHHGVVDCRRVCGWRVIHAISLGHGIGAPVAWVRAEAED